MNPESQEQNYNFSDEGIFLTLKQNLNPGNDEVLDTRLEDFSNSIAILYSRCINEYPYETERLFLSIISSSIELINKFSSNNENNKKDAVSIVFEVIAGYINSLIYSPNINYLTLASYVNKFLKAFLKFKNYFLLQEYLAGTASYRHAQSYEFILELLLKAVSKNPEEVYLAMKLYNPAAFGEESEDVDEELDEDLVKELVDMALNSEKRYLSNNEVQEELKKRRKEILGNNEETQSSPEEEPEDNTALF